MMQRARRPLAVLGLTATILAAMAALAPAALAAAAPVILTPEEGALVLEQPVATGTTTSDVILVEVFTANVKIAGVVPNPDATWSATLPLGDGTHTITARAINHDAEISPHSPPRTFTVDLPPAATISSPQQSASLSTTSVQIAGTAQTGTTVTVRENGVVVADALPVSSTGTWGTTLTFAEGAHTIEATATDASGRESTPTSRSFTVDLTAPAAPVISGPAEGAFVGSGTVTVSGTGEPGATVRIYEGATLKGSTTVNTSGAWSGGASFSNGTHTVTAVAVDRAGNQSASSAPRTFTVDTVAPTVTIATANNSVFVVGDPGAISGTAGDNLGVARVEVRFEWYTGAHVKTVHATCPGCPGTAVSWSRVADLNPGYYRAEVTAFDQAGNRSATVEVAFVRL